MTEPLRALVLGSGFAGQGHAEALRAAGVNIVGLASRTREVVERVAAEMEIPYASTDWQRALTDLNPDIVAVGTPGGAHFEPVLAALEQGCHIFCDKPLAATAAEAKQLYLKAREQRVKTAYAASYRYQPHALLAKKLVAEGAIGEPQEVECISLYDLNPLIPFGWSHRLDLGGGRLNNNFTHKLSIVLHVLAGRVLAVNGEARNDMYQAPVVPGVHDFREREQFAPSPGELDQVEWRDVDAEWSYTVLARIRPGREHRQPVSALFRHGSLQPRFVNDYVAFYGQEAAIFISGAYAQGPLYLHKRGDTWAEVPIPGHITASLPALENSTQRNWTHLAREFVADILGRSYAGYQTFKDGWIFQEVIAAVRGGQGWVDIPEEANA
jgi:predicted dehydrogenase